MGVGFMALQKAFVIDGDKSRYAQISTVLSFLSYKVKSLSIAKAAGGVAKTNGRKKVVEKLIEKSKQQEILVEGRKEQNEADE
jgi:hypothetical protein